MGKEWLFWVGGGGGSAGRRGRLDGGMEEEAAASAGCMCAVFKLFDLDNFQFPLTAHHSEFKPDDSFLQEEATISKGVEAPRNSLELEEPAAAMKAASMSLSLAMKQEENLNFPVGIKIKTPKSRIPSALKSRTDIDVSSECSSYSPVTKTPNLVARLMGLDLLPECTSHSNPKLKTKSHGLRKTETILLWSRSNKTFFDDDSSTCTALSLPETPRISSSRRSDSQIHRLSLQLNKENAGDGFGNSAERGRSRRGSRFKVLDENATKPAGNFAKQIVKQVKENVSRRVGVDITNRNRSEPIRRDENLVLLKPDKRNPAIFSRFGDDLTPSCSSKLRFLETTKNKPLAEASTKSLRNSTSSDYSPSHGISNSLHPKIQTFQEQHRQKDCKKVVSRGRCISSSLKKCLPPQGSDHGIKNKREEPFVRSPAKSKARLTDKKCKKTPFSRDVFYISAPTLLPVKKDPSPPVTKLPQKQSQVSDALASKRRPQLSSTPSHSYKLQLHTDKIFDVLENVEPDSTNGCATAPSAEYENYIHRILRRTRKKWHSCSHPLDPTIFHYLELFQPTTATISAAVLSHRSNRKLIFQLVDELLGEILRTRLDFMKLASPINDHPYLVDELCKKIEGFPAAKCEVLEDIDGLIERDLCNLPLQRSFEEEGDNIVCDIAGEITEWLMRETVAEVDSGTAKESRQRVAVAKWRDATRFQGSSSL